MEDGAQSERAPERRLNETSRPASSLHARAPARSRKRVGLPRRTVGSKARETAGKEPELWEEVLDLVRPPPATPHAPGVQVLVSASALKGDAQRFSQEVSHKAEWTIRHLQVDLKTLQVKYKSMFVPAGQYITSPHFRIAGSEGYLRFWPNGYYSTATRLERMRMDLGGLRADSWCAVALSMPADTKLRLRFRIGDQWSELRTCSWEAGSVIQQVWMPPLQEPPEQLDDLVVGVEIHQNLELNPLPGLPSVAWSTPRYGQLPAVDHDPIREAGERLHMTEKLKEGVQALLLTRTECGLALPSPRFGNCAEELRRRPPRCKVRSCW